MTHCIEWAVSWKICKGFGDVIRKKQKAKMRERWVETYKKTILT